MISALSILALSATGIAASGNASASACGPGETAVVTKQAYGAVNPVVYEQMHLATEQQDAKTLQSLTQQGLIWLIPSTSIVCVSQRAHGNYRIQVRSASIPVPLWLDDQFVVAVE